MNNPFIPVNLGAINAHINDLTIHFTQAQIDHLNLQNIGVNNHAAIDNHLGNILNPHAVKSSQLSDLPLWEDLRIGASRTRTTGPNQPAFNKFKDNGAGSNGVYSMWFINGLQKEVFFEVQFPHDIVLGSTVYPHIHYSKPDGNNGTVQMQFEFTPANIGDSFLNTNMLTEPLVLNGIAQDKHSLFYWTPIASAPNISMVWLCRVARRGDLGTDNYANGIWIHSIDFHYQRDAMGSRLQSSKF